LRPVTADGSVDVLAGNVARARTEAVKAAMAAGLLKASSDLLTSDVFASSQDILRAVFADNPKALIQDYRLLKEGHPGPATLAVQISIVPDSRKLKEDLIRLGILFDRSKRPTILLNPIEERAGAKKLGTTAVSKAWTHRIIQRLGGLGYKVESPGAPDQKGADITAFGLISKFQGKAVTFEFQGVASATKTDLGKVQGRYDLSQPPELIAGLAATQMLSQILPAWFRLAGEGRTYDVLVTGIKSNAAYKELRDLFNSGAGGFTSGKESMYAPGAVGFEVLYDGNVNGLARAMAAFRMHGTSLKVTEVTERSVRIEAR
jgi:hypothetical protein